MIDTASWARRLGGDTFLAQTFFRSHQLTRGSAEDFRSLLTWDDLNSILATQRLEPPRLRLSKGGEALPVHRYAVPVTTRRAVTWHRVQPAELHARLAEGASLVVDSIDEMHPPIAEAAEALERFVRTPVQVNAYASWTADEGFGTHWDDHDVIICQLSGAKRWRIYGATRQAPAWRDVEAPPEPSGPPLVDEVLTAGDMLYLPRGWWHAVSADQGAPSLHLTFGLATQTGADFLAWIVDQLRERITLRRDVPRFATTQDQADYVEGLRKELLGTLDEPSVLARWADSLDATHPGRARLSLPYVTELPVRAAVAVRLTCPRAHLADNGAAGTVTLSGAGMEWEFASQAKPFLDALLDGRAVTLGKLAERAGLPVADVAAVLSLLVQGQAAAVVGVNE